MKRRGRHSNEPPGLSKSDFGLYLCSGRGRSFEQPIQSRDIIALCSVA
jgi:hypothetical protein